MLTIDKYTYPYFIVIIVVTISLCGCASTGKSHRNAEGILRTETRSEVGVIKADK